MAIPKRINYGGGKCGDGGGPCQGPDCPGGGDCYPWCDPPPCADGSMPIKNRITGGYECPDPGPCIGSACPPNTCTGPCCINNECVCNDCSWGKDGDWHIYWSCDDEHEIIVLDDNRSVSDLESHNNHFDNSQPELGTTITIPAYFDGDTDAIIPYVSYPNDCYTYLGKKHGETPSDVVTAGLTTVEGLWAGTTRLGTSFSHAVGACEDCGPPVIPKGDSGCMDPSACNYNPNATGVSVDCCFTSGCTDPSAINYDPTACCDDGSCCTETGCTDQSACNASKTACIDDGSCCYTEGCMDPSATNYNANACCPTLCTYGGDETFTYGIWCVTSSATGLSSIFFREINAAVASQPSWTCTDLYTGPPSPNNLFKDWNNNPRVMLPGDTATYDYNVAACRTYIGTIQSPTDLVNTNNELDIGGGVLIPYINSGPCIGVSGYSNYTIIGTNFASACGTCCDVITNPTCVTPGGCTMPKAINYDPAAVVDDGSCEVCVERSIVQISEEFVNYGTYTLQSTTVTTKDGDIQVQEVFCGCTDPAANNYWSWATVDPLLPPPPGSCTYGTTTIYGCTDDGTSAAGTMFGNLTRPSIHPVGVAALNYNSSATSDDSSCLWCTWTSGSGCTTNGVCNSGGSGWYLDYSNSNINGNYPRSITIALKPNGNGISEVKLDSNQVSNSLVTSLTKDTSFTSMTQTVNAANGWEKWSVTLGANVGFMAPNNTISFLIYESDGAGGTSVCNAITIDIGLG